MIKELVSDTELLSTPCEAATAADEAIAQDLVDTLANTEDAACLAANQIGVPKAIVAYLDGKDQPHVLYNPKLVVGFGAVKASEQCLTLDGTSQVTRYNKIKIAYDELKDGELVRTQRDLKGWTAQIVQHMIDHCAGKLV
ncbi:MAG: peptide deformylase [Eggerthellaceae bacterium]|jgi:peptide deformylase